MTGKVRQVAGLVMEVTGIRPIGEICRVKIEGRIPTQGGRFSRSCTLLMPLEELKDLPGCPVLPTGKVFRLRAGRGLMGKVLTASAAITAACCRWRRKVGRICRG